MNMRQWFRRRRLVAPPEHLSLSDANAIHAWGLGLLDWRDMPNERRAWHRENITKAPYFTTPEAPPHRKESAIWHAF